MPEDNFFSKEAIDELLTDLYRLTGYDFREYAPSTISRRLKQRLASEQMSDISELHRKLWQSSNFAQTLIQDFSINVTEMFRDPHFFRYFRESVVPELKDIPLIRIWVAGCSTGEEAYSLAILLHEEGLYPKCRIYATDMNESVLQMANSGFIQSSKIFSYAQNYYKSGGKGDFHTYLSSGKLGITLKEHLLKRITFYLHHLSIDGSFNEFHVIFCRNVLIYFNRLLREHVHQLLYNSLAKGGFLALGAQESIQFTPLASKYEMLNPQQKIFRRH